MPRPVDPLLSSPVPAANAAFCKSNVPILPNQMDHSADLHQFDAETLGDTPDLHYPGGSDYHDYMDLPEDDLSPPVPDAETGTCPRRAFFVYFANNSDGSFFLDSFMFPTPEVLLVTPPSPVSPLVFSYFVIFFFYISNHVVFVFVSLGRAQTNLHEPIMSRP